MMEANLPGLDLDRLGDYLRRAEPTLAADSFTAELARGGRSNLTYFVTAANGQEFVLRRPPLGHVQATAHDMAREYRVMSALTNTEVAVPHTFHLCTDADVLGAPIDRAKAISHHVIDTLVALHACEPDQIGLGDFGRTEGFLERQVSRWSKQLEGSRSRDIAGIDDLLHKLANSIPATKRNSIVHGDFRLDNCIIGANNEVAAVVDWEMATLGDSFTDLGLFVVYWDGLSQIVGNPVANGIKPEYGFPSASDLLERYARKSGSELSNIEWYIAFGYFKLAVILEGIYLRFSQGQTVGPGFAEIGPLVEPLVSCGHRALRGE
jgi:aminoglycoside phosphotransferase (APT) family kinase protein